MHQKDHWPKRSCWRCCFEFTKKTTFSCLLQVHSQRSILVQIEVQKHQPGRANQNNKRDGCIHAICDTFGGSPQEATKLLHSIALEMSLKHNNSKAFCLSRISTRVSVAIQQGNSFCLVNKLVDLKLYSDSKKGN